MSDLPVFLSGTRATGMVERELIAQYELGSGKNFTYLILDWNSKHAAIVDPQKDLSRVLADLKRFDFSLDQAWITHTHPDHTAGLGQLMASFPSMTLSVSKGEAHRLSPKVLNFQNLKFIEDETILRVGRWSWRVIATPGHSAGELCFFLDRSEHNSVPYLLTGDTIFIRDCGRTDFEDGSDEEMFHSIQKIKTLPKDTVLLVGHHYAPEVATTIARECASSAPFLCKTVDELRELP